MDRNNFVQFCNLRCLCIVNSCAACCYVPASFFQGRCDKALLFSLWLHWSLQDCNKLWHRSSSFGVQNVVPTHAYLAHRLMQYSFLWYNEIGGSVLHIDSKKHPKYMSANLFTKLKLLYYNPLHHLLHRCVQLGCFFTHPFYHKNQNHKNWQLCLFIHIAAPT